MQSDDGGAQSASRGQGSGWLPRMTLPQHGLTRYLRVRLEVAEGMLLWAAPRALLGVLPLGVRHVGVPLDQVGSVGMRRVMHPLRLSVGAAGIVLPWLLAPWWVSIPLVVLGAWVILVSIGPHLEVVTRGGARHRAGVCFAHHIDGDLFATAVNEMAGEAGGTTSSDQ